MTPNQARAARAMLNLPITAVCESTSVGKRTLTEFEAGIRNINDSTRSKIVAFYIARGISFQSSEESGDGVSLRRPSGETLLGSAGAPFDLREFVDHFSTGSIIDDLNALKDTIERLRLRSRFSRDLISLALRRNNITQKDLAKSVGISASHISAVIIGKKALSVDLAQRLSSLNLAQEVHAEGLILAEREINALLHIVPMHIDRSAKAMASIYENGSS